MKNLHLIKKQLFLNKNAIYKYFDDKEGLYAPMLTQYLCRITP